MAPFVPKQFRITGYEASVIHGRSYIAMQYIHGKNLNAIPETVSLAQKVDVMQRIASAVHAAHQLGILHRISNPPTS